MFMGYSLISLFLVVIAYMFLYIKPVNNDFIIKLALEINWIISIVIIGLNKICTKKQDEINFSQFLVEQFYFKFAVVIAVIRICLYIKALFV